MGKDTKTTTNNTGLSNTDNLKMRMLKAKAALPKKMNYIPLYEHDNSVQLKTEDKMKLRRTWNLLSMDEAYVTWFEGYAQKLKVG